MKTGERRYRLHRTWLFFGPWRVIVEDCWINYFCNEWWERVASLRFATKKEACAWMVNEKERAR